MPLKIRASLARGFADLGWLKSFHSFSFASYYDPKFQKFGPLRVINEDTVAGGEGFPTHGHSNFEIFSYILSGALEHKDSMGNREVLHRGDIQFTSAGTGISHSEFNASREEPVRFLQIWVKPCEMGLKPGYQTRTFDDAAKTDNLLMLISPDGRDGTVRINQDFFMYAALLTPGRKVEHSLEDDGIVRSAYVHVPVSDKLEHVTVNGVKLTSGDGLFITAEPSITIEAGTTDGTAAEFVLFDLTGTEV